MVLMEFKDPIQYDKVVTELRQQIVILQHENTVLFEENIRLKNKPVEELGHPPIIHCPKNSIDLAIPTADWTTRHFIRYFQELYLQKYKMPFKITTKMWSIYTIRIKSFKTTNLIFKDSSEYKRFITWLFTNKFNTIFIASIFLITSDLLLSQWLISTNHVSRQEKIKKDEAHRKANQNISDAEVTEALKRL